MEKQIALRHIASGQNNLEELSSAAAGDEKKRDDKKPDIIVLEKVAKTVVHKFSVSVARASRSRHSTMQLNHKNLSQRIRLLYYHLMSIKEMCSKKAETLTQYSILSAPIDKPRN